MYAPVAQLDRVPGFGPGGWGFEPSRAYFLKPSLFNQAWLFYWGNQFLFHLHEQAQTYQYNIGVHYHYNRPRNNIPRPQN